MLKRSLATGGPSWHEGSHAGGHGEEERHHREQGQGMIPSRTSTPNARADDPSGTPKPGSTPIQPGLVHIPWPYPFTAGPGPCEGPALAPLRSAHQRPHNPSQHQV